jgi:hypothetical protein
MLGYGLFGLLIICLVAWLVRARVLETIRVKRYETANPTHEVLETDKSSKSMLGDVTYLFGKRETSRGAFLYTCARILDDGEPGPTTKCDSGSNLTPEEVEQLSQFNNIIVRHGQ